MEDFKAIKYIENSTDGRYQFIFNFIKEYSNLSSYTEITKNILESLDESFFEELLKKYINQPQITSQIRGHNFITFFKKLFEDFIKYGVINDVLNNKSKWDLLSDQLKTEIEEQLLPTKDEKDIIAKGELEITISKIDNYIKNIDNHIKKITKIIELKKIDPSKTAGEYTTLMSMIACQLVLEFGFKNEFVKYIMIDDVDFDKKTIVRWCNEDTTQSIVLSISDKLYILLTRYLKIRTMVCIDSVNNLLVKADGYCPLDKNGQVDNTMAFKVFKKTIIEDVKKKPKFSVQKYSNSSIYNLIDKGYDIATVSNISGYDVGHCIEILKRYNDENDLSDKIISFEEISKNIEANPQNTMTCPFCKSSVSDKSDDWVLIKDDKGIMRLSCVECKGGLNENL